MTVVLHGKTPPVIGGLSGIGNAIAHRLEKSGARVSIAARTPNKVEAAVARLNVDSGYLAAGI
jgi:NADP-dependent 3-hydroxy acid dehydrogenase YdfG